MPGLCRSDIEITPDLRGYNWQTNRQQSVASEDGWAGPVGQIAARRLRRYFALQTGIDVRDHEAQVTRLLLAGKSWRGLCL